jgi:transposase
MLYAGLDLSRQRLDVHVLDEEGQTVEVTAVTPEVFGLRELVARISRHGDEVSAVIESMNGARFVHDQLELAGWDVEIADAVKVKGLAPLAAKTDKIDARVLAELSRRDLVPAIWLPDPTVRAERERARFRLHLVRHRTALKNRIRATLIAFGHPVPVSDLFGAKGRELLASLAIPEPWATHPGHEPPDGRRARRGLPEPDPGPAPARDGPSFEYPLQVRVIPNDEVGGQSRGCPVFMGSP